MTRPLVLVPLLALATGSPATACTLDNCVEVRRAAATWIGDDLHEFSTQCVVTGRGTTQFAVAAEAHGSGEVTGPSSVSVRCVASVGGSVVFDSSKTTKAPASAFAGAFVSGFNVTVCVYASGRWPDGHVIPLQACDYPG